MSVSLKLVEVLNKAGDVVGLRIVSGNPAVGYDVLDVTTKLLSHHAKSFEAVAAAKVVPASA